MRKSIKLLLTLVLIAPTMLFAQEDDKKYAMVETTYMKAKIGMEDKFTAAVKAHNAKYHNEAPYEAFLNYIYTGEDAGWFVWVTGPMTYTDMDGAPGQGDHSADWSKNVSKYVEEYGRVELWRYNDKYSVNNDVDESKSTLMFIDIQEGQYYRFKAFMEKIKPILEAGEREMHLWMSQYYQGDARDGVLVWNFDKWAEMDNDDWNIEEAYDKEYGDGAWENALEEWKDVVDIRSREVWIDAY